MIDYYVIVIGGGRPTSTVPALSRKADCAFAQHGHHRWNLRHRERPEAPRRRLTTG